MSYYEDRLSASRLKRCYEIAPPRVRQYLDAEISYVINQIKETDSVLEPGCGYGRVLEKLSRRAGKVTGIDTSVESVAMAKKELGSTSNCSVFVMDASCMSFSSGQFDVVACIQNGISAFGVDRRTLIRECVRVTKKGGTVLFSSYSDKFWEHRLEWFQLQAKEGLIGEIDCSETRDGVIVTRDGFKAATVRPKDFLSLTKDIGFTAKIVEVDESSVFCEITP